MAEFSPVGWNSAGNMMASLRANAARAADRAQQDRQFNENLELRQEALDYSKERDAVADERADAQFELDKRLAETRANAIRTQLDMEKQLHDRQVAERAKSQIEFQAFTEKTRDLNMMTPEGRKAYNQALSDHLPGITDPNTVRSFGAYNDIRLQGAASHISTALTTQARAQAVDDAEALMAFRSAEDGGVGRDPESAEELATWRRHKNLIERIDDADIGYDEIQVEGFDRNNFELTTPEIHQQVLNRIEDIEASERGKTPSILAMEGAQRRAIDASGSGASLADIAYSTIGGETLSVDAGSNLRQILAAQDLSTEMRRSVENYSGKTGKFIGPFDKFLKEFFQDDADAVSMQSAVVRLIPSLAKGPFAETGVLSDPDTNRYASTIASFENTKDANRKAMAETDAFINRKLAEMFKIYAQQGYNVAGFRDVLAGFEENRVVAFYQDIDTAGPQVLDDLKLGRINRGSLVSFYDPQSGEILSERVSTLLANANSK